MSDERVRRFWNLHPDAPVSEKLRSVYEDIFSGDAEREIRGHKEWRAMVTPPQSSPIVEAEARGFARGIEAAEKELIDESADQEGTCCAAAIYACQMRIKSLLPKA